MQNPLLMPKGKMEPHAQDVQIKNEVEKRTKMINYSNSTTKNIYISDLCEYTIFPYEPKHKKLADIVIDEFEESSIVISSCVENRNIEIPCCVLREQKRIYVTVSIFNEFFELLSGMNPVIKDKIDLSLLQSETREAYLKNFKIAYRGRQKDIEQQRRISKLAVAQANPTLKYIKTGGLVHAKCCPDIERLKDGKEEYEVFNDIQFEQEVLCERCADKIYILKGIEGDIQYFQLYYRFFKLMNLKDKQLKHLFLNQRVRVYINPSERNTLCVKYKSDSWKIIRCENERYMLFHNNYKVDGGNRVILQGFHEQKIYYKRAYELFQYMQDYDYSKFHLQKPEKSKGNCESAQDEKIMNSKIKTWWMNLYVKVKKLFMKKDGK